VLLEEGEVFSVPLRVVIDKEKLDVVTTEITFVIRAADNVALTAQETAVFIGPDDK
jgi:hypothetical protein